MKTSTDTLEDAALIKIVDSLETAIFWRRFIRTTQKS